MTDLSSPIDSVVVLEYERTIRISGDGFVLAIGAWKNDGNGESRYTSNR